MQKRRIRIGNIISYIIMIAILIVVYQIYQRYNFNDFMKAEYNIGLSNFERDKNVKISNMNSYKIENPVYNDSMFYKTVNVTENTPYRVTCKIKTQDVKTKEEGKDGGAHICIADTLEKSNNVTGTSDWTEAEFYFNSKNRTKVDIGFRLGGSETNCVGTAWFSDFKIESGLKDETNNWNFLCIFFDNVDVNIKKNNVMQNVKLQLKQKDKEDIRLCMNRFKNSMEELSYGKIKVLYDIVETEKPITNLSYDNENGYFVSGYDVRDTLDKYIKQGKYDHIFIVFRTGDINQKGAIPVNDWIGLGYMEYRGIGFSNIRLPDEENNYVYKYDTRINIFPEEVLIHEFLHTLERNAEEYGYQRPALHDSERYGYTNKALIGLKNWYQDYMNKEIKTSSGSKVGLPAEIFKNKPTKSEDFIYSYKLNEFKEPENIIEELNNMFYKIINLFSNPEQIQEAVNEI